MGTTTVILFGLGGIIALVGGILTLVAAFRQSIWWGVGCLFLAPVNLVFTIVHWAEAKAGFLTSLAGTVLVVAGLVSSPDMRTLLGKVSKLDPASLTATAAAPPKDMPETALTAQIQEQRQRLETLEAKFAQEGEALTQMNKALNERRAKLAPNDEAAINQFNQDAAEYKARNTARPQASAEIATARGEVERLLDERARLAASAPAAAKRVVMYTTATCPACKAAKTYFAQKGVAVEERDLGSSPEARSAFQSLGGRAVPLILVGNEKMEGFNPDKLNKLL